MACNEQTAVLQRWRYFYLFILRHYQNIQIKNISRAAEINKEKRNRIVFLQIGRVDFNKNILHWKRTDIIFPWYEIGVLYNHLSKSKIQKHLFGEEYRRIKKGERWNNRSPEQVLYYRMRY